MFELLVGGTVSPRAPIAIQRISGFQARRKRIVLFKLDHMGDLFLSLPAISRLRARFPAAQVDIVVGSWNVETARATGFFENVYTYDFFKRKSSEPPDQGGADIKALVACIGHCDIAIDLRRQPDTRFLLTQIDSDLLVGYGTGIGDMDAKLHIALKQFPDIPFRRTPLNDTHITQQMLALIDALPDTIDDYIALPPLHHSTLARCKGMIALFPRAGNSSREWGDLNYLDLAKRLATDDDIVAINCFFGSPEEARDAGFEDGGKLKLCSGLGFGELVEQVSLNQICVSNNSLGAHIAAYLGVSTLGIYSGHETPEEWAPYFGNNYVIRRRVSCSPCHLPSRSDCSFEMECLQIPVKAVYLQVRRMLNEVSLVSN